MMEEAANCSDAGITVIIPVFNGRDTISAAIDSIIYQKCRYPIEIIVIDDASTDGTSAVVEKYFDKCNIRIFKNPENRGNAYSFYIGLKNTSTKYWAVLDADDYYSNYRKIEKQIDFLERDEKEDYVGVAHNYIIDYGDGSYNINNLSEITEFEYDDVLIGHIVYCHTSTYVYRNIYNGNPPEFLSRKEFHGDTVRTNILLRDTKKKIAVIPIVGSHYIMNGKGMWSSLSIERRKKRVSGVYEALKSVSETKHEIAGYNYLILRDRLTLGVSASERKDNHYLHSIISEINESIHHYCGSESIKGYCSSIYYDSLLESLSYPHSIDKITSREGICIFITESNEAVMNRCKKVVDEYSSSKITLYYFGNSTDLEMLGVKVIRISDKKTFDDAYDEFKKSRPLSTYFICSESNYYPVLFYDMVAKNHIILTREDILVPGMVHPFVDSVSDIDGRLIKKSRDEVGEHCDLMNCRINDTKRIVNGKIKDFAYLIIGKVVVR